MFGFISALLTAFVFTSCDPGFAVILSNQSSVERNITLVNHEWGMYRDSIRLLKYEDKNNSILSFTALKAIDTSQKKYSFVLPPGYDAILRSGIGAAYVPKDLVILSGKDTISRSSFKRKVRFMYSEEKAVIQ